VITLLIQNYNRLIRGNTRIGPEIGRKSFRLTATFRSHRAKKRRNPAVFFCLAFATIGV